ncbi:hypothetical protein KKE60_07640 [Patescibacteria group bacterium]|nr:hypothetical protein [Patescibacteria group bacterium]
MTLKEFLIDWGKLLVYVIIQPFVILYQDFRVLLIKTDKIGRPKFLHKFFCLLFVFYYFVAKNYNLAYTFLACTIISALKFHKDTGMYKHWWKERKIKILMKKSNVIKDENK